MAGLGRPAGDYQVLTLCDQDKLFEDDCLLARTLLLKVVATVGLKMAYPDPPPLLTLLENPRDPVSFLGSEAAWLFKSSWGFNSTTHMNRGPVGHAKVKPDNIAAHGFYWPA